jgi:glycosyltransferase involved in cell wall biosynthesis
MRVRIAHVATVDLSLHHLLLAQMQSQLAEGWEVVGVSAAGPHVGALERAGVRHHAVPLVRQPAPLADLRALVALTRLYRRERFTLVHTHTPKAALLGQLAARLAGVPWVVNTLHGIPIGERTRPWAARLLFAAERLGAACSDRILSQSQADLEIFLEEEICPPSKIRFLGNGIDVRRFDPRRVGSAERAAMRERFALPATARVAGFIGRLTREKGFDLFLEAFARAAAHDPSLHCLVVGEPDLGAAEPLGEGHAAQLGVLERCRLVGWRPASEVPALLAAMDGMVLPSVREGFPRAVMEASAMAVPVVASDVRGCRQAVFPGENGLLVPYGDVAGFAAAIERVLGDPAYAAQLGRGGRRLAEREFDEQRVFARVKETYRELLPSLAKG